MMETVCEVKREPVLGCRASVIPVDDKPQGDDWAYLLTLLLPVFYIVKRRSGRGLLSFLLLGIALPWGCGDSASQRECPPASDPSLSKDFQVVDSPLRYFHCSDRICASVTNSLVVLEVVGVKEGECEFEWYYEPNHAGILDAGLLGKGRILLAFFPPGWSTGYKIRLRTAVEEDEITVSQWELREYFYYSDDRAIPLILPTPPRIVEFRFREGADIDRLRKELEQMGICCLEDFRLAGVQEAYEGLIRRDLSLEANYFYYRNFSGEWAEDIEFVMFHFEFEDGRYIIPDDFFFVLFQPETTKEWIDIFNEKNRVEIKEEILWGRPSKYYLKTKFKTNLGTLFTANNYHNHPNIICSSPNFFAESWPE